VRDKLDGARDMTPTSKGKQWLASIMSPTGSQGRFGKKKKASNVRSMQVLYGLWCVIIHWPVLQIGRHLILAGASLLRCISHVSLTPTSRCSH
jgi:hypothetical protein